MVDSALKIIRNRKYLLILIATCLIMHCCALADLLLQANVSMNLINIFLIIISLIPLGIIAFLPRCGSWIILAIWYVSLFPCDLWNPLPEEYMMSCMMAIGALGYCHLGQKFGGCRCGGGNCLQWMTGKLFPRMLFLHRNCCTWLRCWFWLR